MPRTDRRSWSHRQLLRRLFAAFHDVRMVVREVDQRVSSVQLKVDCPEVFRIRALGGLEGDRAVMHVGHVPGSVCAFSGAALLGDNHLIGLFLHEFGHIGSGGGERDANEWIRQKLGIKIRYLGPLRLEWIDDGTVNAVMGWRKV